MDTLLVLPILVPFATAILGILLWENVAIQRMVTVGGLFAGMLCGFVLLYQVEQDGIQATQVGDWPAPFGITLVADMFSAIMVAVAGLMGFLVMVFSLASLDKERERFGYYPIYSILIMGVSGAFLTGDMFNLYVWFEVLLISSFVLMALGGERQQLYGAVQYVTLNLLSSAIFLAAVGMLYSVTGTLNMADLSGQIQNVEQPGIVTALAMMFLISFGIKAAIFPLFFWLPASYHTPPISVTAIFAALLTKVGVYALIRMFTLIFVHDLDFTHTIILVVAGFTMVSGVLGAASEYEFRKILSFHIISQIGYMIMGLGLLTTLSLAATIYFIVHNIIAKTNLFLISGVTYRLRGTYQLKKLGGLYKVYPVFGLLFLVPALSLAGIPPLSGFWGKFALVRAGLEIEEYLIIGVSLFVGVFTLYSMMKIWAEGFLKNPKEPYEGPDENIWQPELLPMMVPIIILAGITIAMGVAIDPFFDLAITAGEQLTDTSAYVEAVLGESAP